MVAKYTFQKTVMKPINSTRRGSGTYVKLNQSMAGQTLYWVTQTAARSARHAMKALKRFGTVRGRARGRNENVVSQKVAGRILNIK
jgi:hypothetical protein